jgi:hypothetical protein
VPSRRSPLPGSALVSIQHRLYKVHYCGVDVDACLASCTTSSISTQGGNLDGKEAFGHHEIVVCNMQSLPSGFQCTTLATPQRERMEFSRIPAPNDTWMVWFGMADDFPLRRIDPARARRQFTPKLGLIPPRFSYPVAASCAQPVCDKLLRAAGTQLWRASVLNRD